MLFLMSFPFKSTVVLLWTFWSCLTSGLNCTVYVKLVSNSFIVSENDGATHITIFILVSLLLLEGFKKENIENLPKQIL